MNYDIFGLAIQQAGTIALETTYILGNSKNIDTMKGRYKLLLEVSEMGYDSIFDTLKHGQSHPEYATNIQITIDRYKSYHYDRRLQDYQLSLLTNPNSFDLNTFYCVALVNAMMKFSEEQTEEIKTMKKVGSKIKRIAKALETLNTTRVELDSMCSTNSMYAAAVSGLQQLSDSLKSL